MEWYQWVISGLALAGTYLNIRKNPACFGIWIFTNWAWMHIDARHGLIAQASLQYVYFLLSIWGLFAWTDPPADRARNQATKSPAPAAEPASKAEA